MAEETKNNATAGAGEEVKDQNQEGQEATKEVKQAEEVKGTQEQQTVEQVVMSKDEFDKKLQAETDRRVNQAQRKWEQEYRDKLEKERADVERLAQLSAEEREKELFNRSKEELAAKERVVKHREMKLQVVDELAKENLPYNSDVVDMMIDPESAESTFKRIKWFRDWHRDQIEKEVNNRLKSQPPKEGMRKKEAVGDADMNAIIRGAFKR